MASRRVLIVGAEENPGLCLIESLTRKGIEVSVASHQRICVGFFSKYPTKRFIYPAPLTNPDGFINEIKSLVKKERFDVTLVAGEETTRLLTKHKAELEQYTRIPLVDFDTYMKCRDKSLTMKIASKIGIPTPKTYFIENDNIKEIANKINYPAVIKPNSSNGGRGISYPNSPEQLVESYYGIKSKYGECHIQEYIPHSGMQYKAEILLDKAGSVKAWCAYNKPRYYPVTGGSSTINCTVDRRDILNLGAKILKDIGWYGIGDCDFIEDPRDHIPKLMEINPRFTRSVKICALAGVDFPYLLYKLAMGEDFDEILNYKVDIYLRYFFSDVLWFLKSSERFKAKPSFFKFFDNNLRDEIISLKDLGPSVAFMICLASSLMNKKGRELRLR